MFNAEKLCTDYNIPYTDKISGEFINIQCPFCDDKGMHLGINTKQGYSTCFRCGYHPLNKVISILTRVNQYVVKDIIKKYSTKETAGTQQSIQKNIPSEVIFPPNTKELTNKAKKYLISRKYDPDKIISMFKILSTGHIGMYKHRILIPIYFKNQLVSYQCRDITGKSSTRYLACDSKEEIIPHKHCLYNFDQAVSYSKTTIIVEGVTDVWRLGKASICLFGISFTKQQARLIAMNFDKVFIMFDSEPQAQEKAEELGVMISSAFSNPVEVINLPFIIKDIDPGDLSQDDADSLMKEIGL